MLRLRDGGDGAAAVCVVTDRFAKPVPPVQLTKRFKELQVRKQTSTIAHLGFDNKCLLSISG